MNKDSVLWLQMSKVCLPHFVTPPQEITVKAVPIEMQGVGLELLMLVQLDQFSLDPNSNQCAPSTFSLYPNVDLAYGISFSVTFTPCPQCFVNFSRAGLCFPDSPT